MIYAYDDAEIIAQANLLQSVGCQMVTMMFIDGKIITVGTQHWESSSSSYTRYNLCIPFFCMVSKVLFTSHQLCFYHTADDFCKAASSTTPTTSTSTTTSAFSNVIDSYDEYFYHNLSLQ